MILQFSVSNYRCFREPQTLSLAASGQDKTLPENCTETNVPGLAGKRWLKGAAFYGANASGKSTLLKALETLASLVKISASATDPKEPIRGIEPFALCPGEPDSPTAFAVIFVTEGTRYEYRVAATRERIWHESLRAFPKKVEQVWFNRNWNAGSECYVWTPARPTGFRRDPQLEEYTLSNMLFLSKAVASNHSDLEPVFRWFKERLFYLDVRAYPIELGNFTLDQLLTETPLRDQIVELIRHADLGVTGLRAVERRPPESQLKQIEARLVPEQIEQFRNTKWMQPELTHRGVHTTNVPLPWLSESVGTRQLFFLAGLWLHFLGKGCTVCLDELETSMHPLMVRELLRLFFSAKENSRGAQILFTTHNPLLLDASLLRRDQVWFTDKDAHGEAHLYPLTDYSPRKGESLVRGYMSGRYGGVPFIPVGLLGSFGTDQAIGGREKEAHE